MVDGGHTKVLLQIFSANAIGPIFFEFIQRKGDDGFGEGNFKALFESIEEDQGKSPGSEPGLRKSRLQTQYTLPADFTTVDCTAVSVWT